MSRSRTVSPVRDLFPRTTQPRSMRVGVELELLTFDSYDGSFVPIERVRPKLRSPHVGFEPGGQLELSLPCVDTVAALEGQVALTLRRVHAAASRVGRADGRADGPARSGRRTPPTAQSSLPRHAGALRPDRSGWPADDALHGVDPGVPGLVAG